MDPLSEEIAVWKCDGCYVTVVTLWVLLLKVTQGTQFVFPIIPMVIGMYLKSRLLIVVLHLLILAAENKTWQLLRDGCYTLATYILSIPRPLMCVSIHTYCPSNTNSRPKATKKRFDYAFALPSSHLRPEVGIKSPERHETNKMRQKGDQFTNAPFDRPLIAICSHFCCPGTPLANKKRNIFFCSPYRCPGNHFTNGIRSLSTFGTHSFFCSFFVRIKSAMATEWRMKYEQFSISS